MSKKRFSDAQIFDKAWYRKLEPNTKLLWLYMCAKCDHVGILEVDLELFSFQLGFVVGPYNLNALDGQFEWIKGTKIFISDFTYFQYGVLNNKSNVHRSCVKRLYENDLIHKVKNSLDNNEIQALVKSCATPKDKEKDKEKDTDKDKDKDKDPPYTTKDIPFN